MKYVYILVVFLIISCASSGFDPGVHEQIISRECYACKGTGRQDCTYCDGTGQRKCGYCDGSGLGSMCVSCNGAGRVSGLAGGWSKCYSCNGRGYYACYSCHGRGWVKCSYCDGKGWKKCTYCNGTGNVK